MMLLVDKDLVCSLSIDMLWEQKPNSANFIELDYSQLDSYGTPRVKLHWGLGNNIKKAPLIYMKELGKLFIDEELGRVGISPFLIDKNNFPIGDFGGHHMGGTQMGYDPQTGVVDSNLKVFNVKNIWVAGSSVFPSSGYANPTLSIVQLSLRLAEHLAGLGRK